MAGGTDPRSAHDVQPDVALFADRRLARVQAHAHANLRPAGPGVVAQRALRRDRGLGRVACAREREEERVTLRVHLGAAALAETLADDPPVRRHDVAVGVAELLQQPRRPLDVGEDERDRSAGEAHAVSIVTG